MKTLTAIIYPGATRRWLVTYQLEPNTVTQGKLVEESFLQEESK